LTSTDPVKRKKVELRVAQTQTSPEKKDNESTITVEDLTSEEKPGEHYWERLAEKRREALEETLVENQNLVERIEGLEEAHNLVSILTEMLNENENDKTSEEDKDVDKESADGTKEQQQEKDKE